MSACGKRPPEVRAFQSSLTVPPSIQLRGLFLPLVCPWALGLPGTFFHSSSFLYTGPGSALPPPLQGGRRRGHALPPSPLPPSGESTTVGQPPIPTDRSPACLSGHWPDPGEGSPCSRELTDHVFCPHGWLHPVQIRADRLFQILLLSLQIVLSSHNLLPLGYKADQIFPIPTTATSVTKTKTFWHADFPSSSLFSLPPFLFFPSVCMELLPLPQPAQPSNSGKDCHYLLALKVISDGPGMQSPPSSPFSASWAKTVSLTGLPSGVPQAPVLPQTFSPPPTSAPANSVPPSLAYAPLPAATMSLKVPLSTLLSFSSVCSLSWQSYPSLVQKLLIRHQAQGTALDTVGVVVIILSKSWQTNVRQRGGVGLIDRWFNTLHEEDFQAQSGESSPQDTPSL